MATKYTFYLPRPPLVRQSTPHTCWAAALASWLQATTGKQTTEEDMYLKFSNTDWNGQRMLDDDNQLRPWAFPGVANEFKMQIERVYRYIDLELDWILKKLNQRKYLYAIYPKPGRNGMHAVVIYGMGDVITHKPSEEGHPQICMMDPADGLVARPLAYWEKFRGSFVDGFRFAWR